MQVVAFWQVSSFLQATMSKKYAQHFRAEWLKDPNYEKWLRRVEGDDTECVCKYCHCTLSAKRSDIDRHRQTLKHKKTENGSWQIWSKSEYVAMK